MNPKEGRYLAKFAFSTYKITKKMMMLIVDDDDDNDLENDNDDA